MPYPRRLLWDILPRNTPNSQNLLLRCPPTDFSLGGYGILPYPCRLLWDILPQNTPNSQNLLLRCSPTEFTEFTEFGSVGMAGMPYPPTSVRICAICGRLFSARGSVSSVCSVGISFLPRISQIYTDAYSALFSHGIHRIHRIWQRGYCRDAIPSYICEHLCHQWKVLLCQKFLCVPYVLWESLSSHRFHRFTQMLRARFVPTDFTDLHRYLGCAVLPRNSQNSQNLAAWVWQECHTLLHL